MSAVEPNQGQRAKKRSLQHISLQQKNQKHAAGEVQVLQQEAELAALQQEVDRALVTESAESACRYYSS